MRKKRHGICYVLGAGTTNLSQLKMPNALMYNQYAKLASEYMIPKACRYILISPPIFFSLSREDPIHECNAAFRSLDSVSLLAGDRCQSAALVYVVLTYLIKANHGTR